jgi:integrase
MHRWGYNTKQRQEAPEEVAAALRWLADHTKLVSALIDDAGLVRELLESARSLLDGTRAAPSSVRNRMLLSNALDYAVELKLLPANPIKTLKWKPPANAYEVDRRSVVKHTQAQALLAALAAQKPSGERLTAFFALMYYAALRPEEAINLRRDNVTLPPLLKNAETGQMEELANAWGELHLSKPHRTQAATGRTAERRVRNARSSTAQSATAWSVPIPPPLVRILRTHLATFDKGAHGHVHGRGV